MTTAVATDLKVGRVLSEYIESLLVNVDASHSRTYGWERKREGGSYISSSSGLSLCSCRMNWRD